MLLHTTSRPRRSGSAIPATVTGNRAVAEDAERKIAFFRRTRAKGVAA